MPRVSPKFSTILDAASSRRSVNGIKPKTLNEIQLVIERTQALAATQANAQASSTFGTVCTADTISTVSCVCLESAEALASQDPQLAQSIATLHDRAVAELGVDGVAEAIVRLSK